MAEFIHDNTGAVIEVIHGTLEEEQSLKISIIKQTALAIILEMESNNSRVKAQEQDEMFGGFRYQRLIHEIEAVRKLSNDLEAEVLAIDDPVEAFLLDHVARFDEGLDIGVVPARLTKRQFQIHIVSTLGATGASQFGDVINAAETEMTTNGKIRTVMEGYREADAVDKTDAEELIGVLITEGVNGFTQDDLTAVLDAWPIL